MRAVIDTNVLISAMRSSKGPAFRLISQIGGQRFQPVISVGLLLEYESILHRATRLRPQQIEDLLDYVCSVAHHQKIFYLWRPCLRDPADDMVLELAVASGSRTIVTFNGRDFQAAAEYGIEVIDPVEFLRLIGD